MGMENLKKTLIAVLMLYIYIGRVELDYPPIMFMNQDDYG